MVATAVSFINMKGGVGKTTLAMQIAHAAYRANLKVLAVDLDPQSNLSQSLLGPKDYVKYIHEHKPTIVQVFDQYVPPTKENPSPSPVDIEETIIKKASYGKDSSCLDLIPSRLEFSRTLRNPTGKEHKLAKALSKISNNYDLILIDCPPTDSILTDAAYFASRYILVPVKPEFLATIGLPLLARSLNEFRKENDDHEIEICGIVFNHSSSYSSGPEGQTSITEVTQIAKQQGWPIFKNHVNYSGSIPKSAREGVPIGGTSYVRYKVKNEFLQFQSEFFASNWIGVK